MLKKIVHALQLPAEQFVVMPEFQKLRVGVLQQLDGGFRTGGAVVDERPVPADDRQIIGIVGNVRLHDFLPLAIRELRGFSADNLCYVVCVLSQKVGGGRGTRDLSHVENEIVFVQPIRVRLHQGRSGALQLLFNNSGGETCKLCV